LARAAGGGIDKCQPPHTTSLLMGQCNFRRAESENETAALSQPPEAVAQRSRDKICQLAEPPVEEGASESMKT
jgi:hypothetical protein